MNLYTGIHCNDGKIKKDKEQRVQYHKEAGGASLLFPNDRSTHTHLVVSSLPDTFKYLLLVM